jgi:hypothetical protein
MRPLLENNDDLTTDVLAAPDVITYISPLSPIITPALNEVKTSAVVTMDNSGKNTVIASSQIQQNISPDLVTIALCTGVAIIGILALIFKK